MLVLMLSGACGSDDGSAADRPPQEHRDEAPAGGWEGATEDEDPEPDRQSEWESQEGDDWDAFNVGYEAGWNEGCDVPFQEAGSDELYDDDGETVTLNDCQGGYPGDASGADVPVDVPESPEEVGAELGRTDGCNYAFDDLAFYGALHYEREEYDSSICP